MLGIKFYVHVAKSLNNQNIYFIKLAREICPGLLTPEVDTDNHKKSICSPSWGLFDLATGAKLAYASVFRGFPVFSPGVSEYRAPLMRQCIFVFGFPPRPLFDHYNEITQCQLFDIISPNKNANISEIF